MVSIIALSLLKNGEETSLPFPLKEDMASDLEAPPASAHQGLSSFVLTFPPFGLPSQSEHDHFHFHFP